MAQRHSFTRREIARHKCLDCGVNVIKIEDYCMLSSRIWNDKLGLGWDDNLCIACIEKRLGRKLSLRRRDFINFPRVEGFDQSDTLLDRYGISKEMREIREKARSKKARKRVIGQARL